MNEMISIIVPVYNVSKYLAKCVRSILSQTYSNFEIILVDDGSTDDSGVICDELKKIDNRIRVIHKPNGGLSDARNAGLDVSRGEYIGFVDSDDYIESDMYEFLLNNAIKYDADVSCCRYAEVYEDGKRIPIGEDHNICIYDGIDGLKEYLYGKTVDPFVWNKLYKACSTHLCGTNNSSIRFVKGIIGEDNPFNVEILKNAKTVVIVGESKYNYLQRRPGAITNSVVSQKKLDSVYWWDSLRKECIEKYPELVPYALRRQVIFYIVLYNIIYKEQQFVSDKNKIRTFINENLKDILNSNICEGKIKFASWLLSHNQYIYIMLLRIYKKMFGKTNL